MAEGVAGGVLRNSCGAHCGLDGALDGAFVQMVSSDLAGLRVPVATMGRKDPLPTKNCCPRGRLLLERAGELDAPTAGAEVLVVLGLHPSEVFAECRER